VRELRPALVTTAFRKRLGEALAGHRAPRPVTALRENPHRWWGVFLAVGSVLLVALLIGGSAPLGLPGYAVLALALLGLGCGALGWWQRRTFEKTAPPGRFVYALDVIDTRSGRCYVTDLTMLTQARVLEQHLGRPGAQLHLETAEGELSLPFADRRAAERALQALCAARQQYRDAAEQQDDATLAALDPFHELRAGGAWDAICAPLASTPREVRFVLGMPVVPAVICAGAALLLAVPAWFGIDRMRDDAAFSRAQAANTVKEWDAYLKRPDPRRQYDVQLRLKPAAALLAARRQGNPAALHKFLETYGSSLAAAEARTLLHDPYERARSQVSAEHHGKAAEPLRGLFTWLEEHDGPQVEVRLTNDSLGLAAFDAALQDVLRKNGAPANAIDPITPMFKPDNLRRSEDLLLGALADGLTSYARNDLLLLQRGGPGAEDGAAPRPRLAVNWSAAPLTGPAARPIVDRIGGAIYWPLVFRFELTLLVPGQAPFAERFDFEPAKFIPEFPTDHYSLYLRMIELAFDEATQRAALAFFPQHVPKRVYDRPEPAPAPAHAPRLLGSATGFAISPLGYIATARHFTIEAQKYQVQLPGGPVEAELVRDDAENDLAILKLKQPLPGALAIRASSSVRLGESVATLGYPRITVQGMEPKFGRGDISSLSGMRDDPSQFQISVPVQPGNSGGPLVDLSGQVVGVIVSRLTAGQAQTVNYAVKSDHLLKLMEAIPELRPAAHGAAAGEPRKLEDMIADLRRSVFLLIGYTVE
jgi:S1-C subfamily serine protease